MRFGWVSVLVFSLGYFLCVPASAQEIAQGDTGRGEMLSLKTADGKAFSAYRTGPRGARIGILLIHESWGLDDSVRAWADWLGQNGFRVIAPDLYDGKVAATLEEATSLAAGLKQAGVNARYRAALLALKAPGRKQVAMGWAFGGTQAFYAGASNPNEVHAIVSYEGTSLPDAAVQGSKQPVLAIFPRKGGTVSADDVRDLQALAKRQKRGVVVSYYDPRRSDGAQRYYSGDAAQLVWKDTQAFFKRYVK